MPQKSQSVDIGQRIAGIRRRRGLSQTIVARRTGLDPSYLSRLETGKIHPTVKTALKIATALRVSPNDLLGSSTTRRKDQPCPVSSGGQCLLDLIDTGLDREPGERPEAYSPKQLRLLRRFAALVRQGSPELLKSIEVLVLELRRGGAGRQQHASRRKA